MRPFTITLMSTIPQTTAPNGPCGDDIAAIIWLRDWNPPVMAAKTRVIESLVITGVGFRDEYAIESTARELVYARI